MPNLKELKTRIASVKSTKKITSAMKMVAASKLRRAQELAESSRVYADSLAFILSSLAGKTTNNSDLPEILTGRENPKTTLLVVNSSDRGLCEVLILIYLDMRRTGLRSNKPKANQSKL